MQEDTLWNSIKTERHIKYTKSMRHESIGTRLNCTLSGELRIKSRLIQERALKTSTSWEEEVKLENLNLVYKRVPHIHRVPRISIFGSASGKEHSRVTGTPQLHAWSKDYTAAQSGTQITRLYKHKKPSLFSLTLLDRGLTSQYASIYSKIASSD